MGTGWVLVVCILSITLFLVVSLICLFVYLFRFYFYFFLVECRWSNEKRNILSPNYNSITDDSIVPSIIKYYSSKL